MLAKDLIDQLERLGLLDQEIIEALRQQLNQAGARVTPEAVAKLLVDNGQLTSFQASKLIGELRSSQYDEAEGVVEDDNLTEGLVVEEVELVAEAVEAEVMPMEADVIEVEAVPVAATAVTQDAVAVSAQEVPERPQPRRPKKPPKASTWDSFKIYGYLGIITLLLLLGGALWFVLGRENADAVISNANEAYNQQTYEAAQSKYLAFLDGFGQDHEYSSVARTRVVMTQLYKAATFKQKPEQAVERAKELLPTIENEEGMNEERTNLAQLLVTIADNITKMAGRATQTSKKEALLATLDEHQELMDNPLYMSSTARVTLAGQVAAIKEARERVQRDINRNKRLDATEIAMKGFLEEKKTKKAYDERKSLLRDFPELYDNERLTTLIELASDIQKTLVRKSDDPPEVTTVTPQQDNIKSIVLTSLSGSEAADLQGETLYLRAGGSVLAFDGMTGKLKWRKFVGYAKDLPPVGVEDGLGVLLSDSSALEVVRCDAESGKKLWRSSIGEKFHRPNAAKDDVFVATESGRVISLETDSGETKWATQLPQPLEVSPGVDTRNKLLYQPGNHSNLYLMSSRDGSCKETFYIGHNEGTISVAPTSLSGHLFVIENVGSSYAIVHILRVDEQGNNIQVAQDQVRVIGNVHVQPIIQGQRLIVLTDLGEVKVFDVDLNAEGVQVSVVARLPPFYDHPTSTQMTVSGTSMWIAGIRVGRYQLQINTGRVVRTWSKHELDQFIGKPFAGDDTLVHARILRDTSAIRVTAADQKTGEEIWSTDVGVPITMMKPASGGVIHAITAQAALFEVDRDAIVSGSTKPPIEDISDRSVAVRFTNPVPLEKNRVAFLDEAGGESFLIYDPNRPTEKLREIAMRLPSGKPAGHLAYSGKGLFLPLESGRAILLNWQTGAVIAAPFQPASDPATKVHWTTPAQIVDDPDQVVIADNRKKLYRLRVNEQITELASEDIPDEFLGPAARVESTYFATTSGPAADQLVGHDMVSLDQKFKTALAGRVTWGPVASDSHCFVQTDDGTLRAFDANGKEAFTIALPAGTPVGNPVTVDGQLIIVGRVGWYVAIDESSGKLTGQDDLGQPISATPLAIGKRLLIPGAEGVIYVAEVPSKIAKINGRADAAHDVAFVEQVSH